jgi:ribosomal protein S18 acetylase RimI-like enzyme
MRIEEFYRKRNVGDSQKGKSDITKPKSKQSRATTHWPTSRSRYSSQCFPASSAESKATFSEDDEEMDADVESLLSSQSVDHPIIYEPRQCHRSALSQQSTVIRFRAIQPKDRFQIQKLHEEWFPVEYQQEFYDDLCWRQKMCHSGHDLYTMVATIPKESDQNDGGSCDEDYDKDEYNALSTIQEDTSDECIIACLVGCVLSAHKLNRTSRQLLLPQYPHRHTKLFYIMTLGTVTKYRHLGLATQLVQQAVSRVVERDSDVGTMYLHVITLNNAAIRFYEDKLGFWKVQEIPDYYTIDGEHYNCYLYAKYFHGQ